MRITAENFLDDYCTTVTLVKIARTLDSMNRLTATTETTSTIKAEIQWVTKQDLEYLDVGRVKIGDGMLFVLHDADISVDDNDNKYEIIFDSIRWEITSQIDGELFQGGVESKGYTIRKK